MTALLSTRDDPKPAPRLSPGDWIAAALALLAEEGIEAVQITALARRLKVTRGGFYWHFASREALLDALIAEWRARNSGVMAEALAHSNSLEAGVLDLFSVWVDHRRFDPNLDQAVRDWARRDPALAEVVRDEDDARVRTIADFYERNGYEPTEAFVRARVIYFTQLSYYALGVTEPMERRMTYLEAYFRCFTGTEITAAVADAYRDMLTAEDAK